jgi:RNA polymerase sigma factor (sigma-70 family)
MADTVQAVDDEFLVELYEREAAALVGLLHAFCHDRATAEELTQEAFIRLRSSLHRVEDRAKAAAYLRSIGFNLARNRMQRQAVAERARPIAVVHATSTEDVVVLREDQRAVLDALGRLSDRQRACLVLRYYEDMTEREIADTLDMSPNSVKTHVRRGMGALAKLLGEVS